VQKTKAEWAEVIAACFFDFSLCFAATILIDGLNFKSSVGVCILILCFFHPILENKICKR
jgi:hypothetical protein